jgi:hypothetical protein
MVDRNMLMRPRQPVRPFKTTFKKIDRPEPSANRTIGFGQPVDIARIKGAANPREGLGSICDSIKNNMDSPIWNMPIIDQTRGTLLGPASDQTVSQFFGAEIRPFDWTNSTTGFDYVETTFAQSGEPQTHTLVCAIGWHIDVDQVVWTADGNSFTLPIIPGAEPMSPDVFTQNDVNNGQFDTPTQKFSPDVAATPGAPDSVVVPAFLEWGWWAQQVAWFMARGYDLQWKVGHHTNIMDETLRHTAYLIQNAQDGSASSSEVDIARFVRRVNDRYTALGSGMYFSKVDRIRIGSTGAGTLLDPNLGAFRPSRDHQRVGVTYGGGDLRSLLHGNSEFRKMRIPYVFRAGVPYGLLARVNDDTQAELMREYLSISQGQGDGSIPPLEQDASAQSVINLPYDAAARPSNTIVGSPATERTFTGQNVSQQVPIQNAIYKGGEFKLTLAVKGFEVTDEWYTMCQNDPGIRDAIMCETGCGWAKQTA